MGSDKGKKSRFDDGKREDDPENVDKELVFSIEKLQEIQDELEKVNEEASDEVLAVEQKYSQIRRPVYEKRNEIIKTIPDFWITAFTSHPALADLLSEEDHKIFKYLHSLDVEDFSDVKSGYSISFTFGSNPYFEDTILKKTFSFNDDGLTKITGTAIKWKDGMSLTANGDAMEKKGNKRSHTEESFFSWFNESEQRDIEDASHDEVAEIIKEDLWSNPLRYFNNEADEEDFDVDEDDDEMDGDDDDGDDESDQEEDEDDS